MTGTKALQRLRALATPLFTTADVAGALGLKGGTANKVASRLAADGLIVHLARGRWALLDTVNPFTLAEHLVAPYPAYISLQSALFHYGMISQIPHVVYAVTLAKPRRWSTPLGVVSLHQVSPDFFFGYEPTGPGGAQIATPEKALLDVIYLSPGRSRLFARLPEIEFPSTFSKRAVREMIRRVADPRRRQLVQSRWEQLSKATALQRPMRDPQF
jgi:predicted transcriptional regulator of viral defense system